jgi:hypothetical protein
MLQEQEVHEPRATERLARVLRAVAAGPLKHASIEFVFDSADLFPNPDKLHTGVLLSVPLLTRQEAREASAAAAAAASAAAGTAEPLTSDVQLLLETASHMTGDTQQLVQSSLYLQDAFDRSERPRLLPLYSRLLGYGEGVLTHRSVRVLQAHLAQLIAAVQEAVQSAATAAADESTEGGRASGVFGALGLELNDAQTQREIDERHRFPPADLPSPPAATSNNKLGKRKIHANKLKRARAMPKQCMCSEPCSCLFFF